MTAIGRSVPRVDGRAKVTGAARYNVDIQVPGMLHARAVRSPYPHARVLDVDASAAAALPGVVTLTRDDLGPEPYFGPVLMDESVVAVDKVRFVGDIVAAVAAEDERTAEAAAELVAVDYEPLDPVVDPLEALDPSAPVLHERLQQKTVDESRQQSIQPGLETLDGFAEGNLCSNHRFAAGNVEQGFEQADRIFEDVYRVPPIQHTHMEPHTAIAYWEDGTRLVLHCASQDPWVVRTEMAKLFDLPMSQVRVLVSYVGGGYGAKLYPRIEPVVAALARKAERPVGWSLKREDEFVTITRHGAVVEIKTGAKDDGRLVARQMRVVYDAGAYAEISPRVAAQNGPVAAGPYRIPNVAVECLTVYTCKPPAGAFRGFGVPQIAWAYESQMDDIARKLGLDPVELRRRNLYQEGDEYLTGEQLHGVGVRECLDRVAEAIGGPTEVAAEVGGGRGVTVRGTGVACTVKSTMTPSTSGASLRLDADGSLLVLVSGVEIGQGLNTVFAQIAADTLGLSPEQVRVVMPDTDMTPFDHGTKSSRSTFSIGRAVQGAALRIRDQLVELAADRLGAATEDVRVEDGLIKVRGNVAAVTIPDVFRHAFGLPLGNLHANEVFQTEGGLHPTTHKGKDSAFWMWGAAAVEVEVDLELGKVRVLRMASAVDTGKALNPAQCHLQNEGSAIMGLGSALLEELVFEEGQLLNGSLTSYMVPSFLDFPADYRSFLVEQPDPDGPFGAKGVGEAVIPAVAPAIGNAVANALGGRRIKTLPIRPDAVLEVISEGAGA